MRLSQDSYQCTDQSNLVWLARKADALESFQSVFGMLDIEEQFPNEKSHEMIKHKKQLVYQVYQCHIKNHFTCISSHLVYCASRAVNVACSTFCCTDILMVVVIISQILKFEPYGINERFFTYKTFLLPFACFPSPFYTSSHPLFSPAVLLPPPVTAQFWCSRITLVLF